MVTNHVHRVFIVGPGGYPQGVVSITDVCRVYAKPEDGAVEEKPKKEKSKSGDKKDKSKKDNKKSKDKKEKK